jgi:hypothetical protein
MKGGVVSADNEIEPRIYKNTTLNKKGIVISLVLKRNSNFHLLYLNNKKLNKAPLIGVAYSVIYPPPSITRLHNLCACKELPLPFILIYT